MGKLFVLILYNSLVFTSDSLEPVDLRTNKREACYDPSFSLQLSIFISKGCFFIFIYNLL